jgi:hypothetical protein
MDAPTRLKSSTPARRTLNQNKKTTEVTQETQKMFTNIPNQNFKFRLSTVNSIIFYRLFAFVNAPLIKFIFHFVKIFFLLIYFP